MRAWLDALACCIHRVHQYQVVLKRQTARSKTLTLASYQNLAYLYWFLRPESRALGNTVRLRWVVHEENRRAGWNTWHVVNIHKYIACRHAYASILKDVARLCASLEALFHWILDHVHWANARAEQPAWVLDKLTALASWATLQLTILV